MPIEHGVTHAHGIAAVLGKAKALGGRGHGTVEQGHVSGLGAAQVQAQAALAQGSLCGAIGAYSPIRQTVIEYRLTQGELAFIGEGPGVRRQSA
ncbi:hypothetical protein D3C84_295170 [compost metagenome]